MARTVIRVGIAPSKNNPDLPRSQVQADGRATRRNTPTVLFTTEMGERGQDRRDFTAGLGHSYNVAKATADSENPILFRGDRMGQTWSRNYTAHGGKAGISPTRTIAAADLAPLKTGTRRVVDELECRYFGAHYTAFAFSNHFHGSEAWKKAWCREHWGVNDEMLHDLVADSVRAGITTFVAADWNRAVSDLRSFGKGQQLLINGGIDGVIVVPGKRVHVTPVGRTTVVNVPGSDHHFRWRPVELRSVTR